MLPSLPCRPAMLFEYHHLGIDFKLGWEFDRRVVKKELFDVADGADKRRLVVLLLLIL